MLHRQIHVVEYKRVQFPSLREHRTLIDLLAWHAIFGCMRACFITLVMGIRGPHLEGGSAHRGARTSRGNGIFAIYALD